MKERINLRLNKELYDKIEKFRIENNFEDKQDATRFLLNESFRIKESFFGKIINIFLKKN